MTGSWDASVKIWDLKSGNQILTLNGHYCFVFSVAICTNNKKIVTCSADETVKLWNINIINDDDDNSIKKRT